ncbi:hypothetical protein [Fimbriiglobus ruber]|uniref:Glycoside hydrolase family 5 domain-containing protein n=1 Tax=Fimbriiglobus ruber TaxID=1908690 RepID=A0A225D949_9BACT|nr:hypothetical protein [Fimbriiglobus ruber]OWK35068.1 hypothetical protein FRUB_09910 [Fimbriiglobus ruber]
MRTLTRIGLGLIALVTACDPTAFAVDPPAPISLHPDNPRYFLFRGQPTVLVTSAEHYGSVLNTDFNYTKYLDELHVHRLNMTRIFSGVYVEDSKSFGITRNTLAPLEGKYACPWARSDTTGYAGGGKKFDLTKWDLAYFARLKDFLAKAGERGIVVELTLFCPFYDDSMWRLSPMNAANNVNGVGAVHREAVYDREKNGGLQAPHEALVRKLVTELRDFDNLYFEICNEPYFGGVTEDWQRRVADVIVEAEKPLARKHLVSQNIANGSQKIANPHPAVSIFNFHYATPPNTIGMNAELKKAFGDDETGFKGTGDAHYRMEGWEFLLAGGGVYNNLDYSFVAGHEDGSFQYPPKTPGGGNRAFRGQMAVLKDFLTGFDFVKMSPNNKVILSALPPKGHARVLAESGKQYAVYLHGGPEVTLVLDLPPGRYQAEWVDPLTGRVLKTDAVSATGPTTDLKSPKYDPDIALRMRREKTD